MICISLFLFNYNQQGQSHITAYILSTVFILRFFLNSNNVYLSTVLNLFIAALPLK